MILQFLAMPAVWHMAKNVCQLNILVQAETSNVNNSWMYPHAPENMKKLCVKHQHANIVT